MITLLARLFCAAAISTAGWVAWQGLAGYCRATHRRENALLTDVFGAPVQRRSLPTRRERRADRRFVERNIREIARAR